MAPVVESAGSEAGVLCYNVDPEPGVIGHYSMLSPENVKYHNWEHKSAEVLECIAIPSLDITNEYSSVEQVVKIQTFDVRHCIVIMGGFALLMHNFSLIPGSKTIFSLWVSGTTSWRTDPTS